MLKSASTLPDGRFSAEHRSLKLLQTQVIFKFARVLQQIDLRVTIRSQTNPHLALQVFVRRHDSITKISLGCGTRANHRVRLGK